MRKIAKSTGELQAQLAEKATIIEAQALEIERLSQSKRRKRITVDTNTQFSNIEVIKRAQEEAKLVSGKEAENRVVNGLIFLIAIILSHMRVAV